MRVDRTAWTALLLFVVCFGVYRVSPRGQLYDSRFTLAVASQLAHHGAPDLTDLSATLAGGAATPALAAQRDYRLVLTGGRLHYLYPAGTSVLAAPLVLVSGWLGHAVIDDDGVYHRDVERRLQRILAALAMALLAVLSLLTARSLVDERTSWMLTLALAFASPIWSTASRSLWTHTISVLLQGAVVLLLVRRCEAQREVPAIRLATLLSLGVLCRPTAAIPALAVSVWVACTQRDRLPVLLLTGASWAAGFVFFSRLAYATWLPPYYQPGLHDFAPLPGALLGNLVSPARGLLVYSPWIAGVGALLWLRRRRLPHPSLAWLGGTIVVAHWLVVSSHSPWWAGWGYGPRLMTDVIPWIGLLTALTLAAAPPLAGARRAGALLLIVLGVVLHGIGAFSRSAVAWNEGQEEPGFEARLWDWSDPPFTRCEPDRRRDPREDLGADG